MVEKKRNIFLAKYFEKSKWCHMSHSYFTMCEHIGAHCSCKCSHKCNHMNSSLNTCIKSSSSYLTIKIFHLLFVTSAIYKMFATRLILVTSVGFSKFNYKWFFFTSETFWEQKTRTSKDDGLERVTLQNEDVLARLKSTNGHATHNVMNYWQSLLLMVPIHHIVVHQINLLACIEPNLMFRIVPRFMDLD
jgi:hypothetical protein